MTRYDKELGYNMIQSQHVPKCFSLECEKCEKENNIIVYQSHMEVYPPIARQMFSSQPSIQVGPSWAINLLKVRQQISTNNMAMRSFNWEWQNHQKCEKILGNSIFFTSFPSCLVGLCWTKLHNGNVNICCWQIQGRCCGSEDVNLHLARQTKEWHPQNW